MKLANASLLITFFCSHAVLAFPVATKAPAAVKPHCPQMLVTPHVASQAQLPKGVWTKDIDDHVVVTSADERPYIIRTSEGYLERRCALTGKLKEKVKLTSSKKGARRITLAPDQSFLVVTGLYDSEVQVCDPFDFNWSRSLGEVRFFTAESEQAKKRELRMLRQNLNTWLAAIESQKHELRGLLDPVPPDHLASRLGKLPAGARTAAENILEYAGTRAPWKEAPRVLDVHIPSDSSGFLLLTSSGVINVWRKTKNTFKAQDPVALMRAPEADRVVGNKFLGDHILSWAFSDEGNVAIGASTPNKSLYQYSIKDIIQGKPWPQATADKTHGSHRVFEPVALAYVDQGRTLLVAEGMRNKGFREVEQTQLKSYEEKAPRLNLKSAAVTRVDSAVWSMLVVPKQNKFLSFSRKLNVWDLSSLEISRTFVTGYPDTIPDDLSSYVVSPDGKYLVLLVRDAMSVWDIGKMKLVTSAWLGDEVNHRAKFSNDGRWLGVHSTQLSVFDFEQLIK